MAISVIFSDEWITLVLQKLGIDSSRVNRVVIDAQAGQPLCFYITYFGGTELLEVRPPEATEVNVVLG